jgi:hypothetical protein
VRAPFCISLIRSSILRRIRGRTPNVIETHRSPLARLLSARSNSGDAAVRVKALVFIIDEVGQHVARSGDKIEDLRATIEEFGRVGKNLLKERKIIAPCWIVVTSQEKLDEVVAAIDSKRVELARLQDRFRYRVDLAPSDIREVATKRVLAKTDEAEKPLKKLFSENQGQLNAALRLERTTRRTDINESDFIHFYPYPPHYIRSLHRDHVGHSTSARCSTALRWQQPYDHQAGVRDAGVGSYGIRQEAHRGARDARQGVRVGGGQPLE